MSLELLHQAVESGELRLFDLQFAQQISARNCDGGGEDEVAELLLAAALVSYRLARGDTCLSLEQAMNLGIFTNKDIKKSLRKTPSADRWRRKLLEQPVVQEVAASDVKSEKAICPLLLDKQNRLYLTRYWYYERAMLDSIQRLIASKQIAVDSGVLKHLLDDIYNNTSEETDWQMVATAVAALNRFTVITGGPGTGKTYTVAALLAVFEALADKDVLPRVLLAAPTGKAAARLTESLQASSVIPSGYRDLEAVTLHRLLKIIPGRLQPLYNKESPLRADAIVIDEASMIDLPMMTRLLDAIPESCRLILLGDRDQLASVESGMVLGDICGPHSTTQLTHDARQRLQTKAGITLPASGGSTNPLSDHIVYLTRSHRTGDSSGIGELASAINKGDFTECVDYLMSPKYPGLELLPHDTSSIDAVIDRFVVPLYRQVMDAPDPATALNVMSGVCVLCALRRGRAGAEGINRRVELTLKKTGIINTEESHYAGRPVMVTENSLQQNLYNGDIGITMMEEGKLKVYFQGQSALRAFVPGRLPQHDTFYAMTIHKSQGSEYDTVVVVLPDDDSPLLTRELLYTAVTRARRQVVLVANQPQLETAVRTRSERQSGIRDALWPGIRRSIEPVRDDSPPQVPIQTELDL